MWCWFADFGAQTEDVIASLLMENKIFDTFLKKWSAYDHTYLSFTQHLGHLERKKFCNLGTVSDNTSKQSVKMVTFDFTYKKLCWNPWLFFRKACPYYLTWNSKTPKPNCKLWIQNSESIDSSAAHVTSRRITTPNTNIRNATLGIMSWLSRQWNV